MAKMKSIFLVASGSLILHFALLALASQMGVVLSLWLITTLSIFQYTACFILFARLVKLPAVRAIGITIGIALHAVLAYVGLVVFPGAHILSRIFPAQQDRIITYMTNLTMYFIMGFATTLLLGVLSIVFRRRLGIGSD